MTAAGTLVEAGEKPKPPEERGRLVVADRVVERLAAHATRDLTAAKGAPRSLLGVRVGHERSEVRVHADVDGRLARLRVRMSVTYPEPVAEVVHEVRRHIRQEVGRLADLDVIRIDVEVVGLINPSHETPRVR